MRVQFIIPTKQFVRSLHTNIEQNILVNEDMRCLYCGDMNFLVCGQIIRKI